MKFCSACGHKVIRQIPEGDHLERYVCPSCHTIHYQNPRMITGTLPVAPDGRILLCRRNIEPRKNYWTLPAGFMENDETTVAGALRETLEEADVRPVEPKLLSVVSLPRWNQVHLFYQVRMVDYHCATTAESNAVELFAPDALPWPDIAFKTVERTLQHYLACLTSGYCVLNDEIDL